ncbi:MAG: protein kinase domain-containing protein [Planctomycetota bacterium]
MNPTEAKGRWLGDFEIIREIGRGGMGIVYQARQVSLNREVALKVLSGGLGLTSSAVQRFKHEAEAAARLHHTHIVPIYATGEENGIHYYAMELVEGPSLKQVIERLRRGSAPAIEETSPVEDGCECSDAVLPAWGIETAAYDQAALETGTSGVTDNSSLDESSSTYFENIAGMVADLADALEHAHTRSIIHRDIKPSNVMLAAEDRLTIADFGLARIVDQPNVTITGEFLGTPMYMSPEQVAAGRVPIDHRTDIYSLGATLYELLTLRPPFLGQQREQVIAQVLQKDAKPPRKLNKRLPVDLQTICLKAMEKDPDRRYQTAAHMAEDLRRYVRGQVIHAQRPTLRRRITKFIRRNKIAVTVTMVIASLLLIASIVGWNWYTEWQKRRREQFARRVLLPETEKHLNAGRVVSAFVLARKAGRTIPDDPLLNSLWLEVSLSTSIITEPSDVLVEVRDWQDADAQWMQLGRTPLKQVRLPRGYARWRFAKKGYAEVERLARVKDGETWREKLLRPNELPSPEMVRVEAEDVPQWGGIVLENQDSLVPHDFFIDQYEVTNKQFKRFVDANGYVTREYWRELVEDVGEAGWEEVVGRFRDSTGEPGPSTWIHGTYRPGEARYPVQGVSWYEAAAYARFVGKQLPTIHHWGVAASIRLARSIVPISNYSRQGAAAVGAYPGISYFGAYDMAGNVKEWCWNRLSDERRYVLGGAWTDAPYMFVETEALSPHERLPVLGFRCVKHPIAPPEEVLGEVDYLFRDFGSETPASNVELQTYRSFYSYDKDTPLNDSEPEPGGGSTPACRHEVVHLDTAPEGERLILHVLLPGRLKPPYQTIVFFPGLGANMPQPFGPSRSPGIWRRLTGFAEHGRAVVLPIFKGTFQRHDGIDVYQIMRHHPIVFRNYVTQVSRELSRTIDYLQTRKGDFASDKIAYVGKSWGALFGPVMTAVDKRFEACVLICGGFASQTFEPEIDPFNFAPHVHIPVLMLNGRYDNVFLYATEQEPLLRALGTPASHKEHRLFETGHAIPPEETIENTNAWLDEHLGPTT